MARPIRAMVTGESASSPDPIKAPRPSPGTTMVRNWDDTSRLGPATPSDCAKA